MPQDCETKMGLFFYRLDDHSPLTKDEVVDVKGNTIYESKTLQKMISQMREKVDMIRKNNGCSRKNINLGLAPCYVAEEKLLKCANPTASFEVIPELNPVNMSDYNFFELC
ncbi:MAG: hypothetical protein ABIE55_02835 [Candidatus Aenigmatarchaeota archaeon]